MKNVTTTILLFVLFIISNKGFGQDVNWRSVTNDKPNLIHIHAGFDYGASIGAGYGRKLRIAIPLILSATYTTPTGKKLTDDFKTRIGGQAEVLKFGAFSTTLKAYGLIRRYESESVRLMNFGSEFSATAGYYKSRWYAAGEIGFDKAITTHIKHQQVMKASFPHIQDGWYIPTGGNFFYGVQSGFSIKSNDVYIKIGKTIAQDLKHKASVPLYFQLGLNARF